LLSYAGKLTEAPAMVGSDDIQALKDVGWSDREVWEITALTSFFNFSGRLEAASGLPPDRIPADTDFAEGRAVS
jgi:alkylhydroperoxidase family enzyme